MWVGVLMPTYDPAWNMPRENWVPQGSFYGGISPPAVPPDGGTPVCIGPIALEWLDIISGALDQFAIPDTWKVANDDEMFAILSQVHKLKYMLWTARCADVATQVRFTGCILQTSTDGGVTWTDIPGWSLETFGECVRNALPPPPPHLGPTPIEQRACNIAGFLATSVLESCLGGAINLWTDTQTKVQFAHNLISPILEVSLPELDLWVEAAYITFLAITDAVIADLRTSLGDPVLWSLVTCAIFNAIVTEGEVTDGNYAGAVANVCALTYGSGLAVAMICNFMTAAGSANFRMLQVQGAMDDVDCSGCSHVWCFRWDLTAGLGPWTIIEGDGVWVPGVGVQSTIVGGEARIELDLVLPHSFINAAIDVCVTTGGTPAAGGRVAIHYLGGVNHGAGSFDSATAMADCGRSRAPVAGAFDEVVVRWFDTISTDPVTICSIAISSNGASPYGPNNCGSVGCNPP